MRPPARAAGAGAVFLDRDGTVIQDRGYLHDPDGVRLLPGAVDGLRRLAAAGFPLVIVTNQSGVGRGRFAMADVEKVHQRVIDLLAAEGIELAGIYVCPHAPDDGCDCRKPGPGLLVRAAADLGISAARSFMVGDKDADILAGNRFGARTVRITGSPGRRYPSDGSAKADADAPDLAAAADWIFDTPTGGDTPAGTAVGVIPARWGSTRFPGKALALLGGRPVLQWVIERAGEARSLERVIVATDDDRILRAAEAAGAEARMTSPGHHCGTDRVAEAVADVECDIVVNIQGDEPFVSPEAIDAAANALRNDPSADIATLAAVERDTDALADPNRVKVVVGGDGYALYFSRAPIPWDRSANRSVEGLVHVGLYAYRQEFLSRMVAWPPSPLERRESLEQLRALENGARIRVVIGRFEARGIDVPSDLEAAERVLRENADSSPR